jgi:hypothetical protein
MAVQTTAQFLSLSSYGGVKVSTGFTVLFLFAYGYAIMRMTAKVSILSTLDLPEFKFLRGCKGFDGIHKG